MNFLVRNSCDFSKKSWFDCTSFPVPYRAPWESWEQGGEGEHELSGEARGLASGSGLAWLGLAWLAFGLAWVWLAFLMIWLGFGLISAGFCFWLSFIKILIGFELIWLDFDWISA